MKSRYQCFLVIYC